MKIVVIDGQGGGLGSSIIEKIKGLYSEGVELIALSTNSIAVSNMIKAGADKGASGENPFKVILPKADIIVAPIAATVPNSMLGEITVQMAMSVTNSNAYKIFIPSSKCGINICGLKNIGLKQLLEEMLDKVDEYIKGEK